MSSLPAIRATVRQDLHDEDASAYRWTDGVLDRHIERALLEYSHVKSLEKISTIQNIADTRNVALNNLTNLIRIVAAEFPIGEYPPSFVPYSVWGDVLTLDLESAPEGSQNVNVFWHAAHSSAGNGTFPEAHDDIIAGGAAGYAALEWASFASNRLNVGGDDVWGRYTEFANVRIREFHEALRRLPEANLLRSGRFYTSHTVRLRSQVTDPGPL